MPVQAASEGREILFTLKVESDPGNAAAAKAFASTITQAASQAVAQAAGGGSTTGSGGTPADTMAKSLADAKSFAEKLGKAAFNVPNQDKTAILDFFNKIKSEAKEAAEAVGGGERSLAGRVTAMRSVFNEASTAALQLVRGLGLIGAASEKDTESMVRSITKVMGWTEAIGGTLATLDAIANVSTNLGLTGVTKFMKGTAGYASAGLSAAGTFATGVGGAGIAAAVGTAAAGNAIYESASGKTAEGNGVGAWLNNNVTNAGLSRLSRITPRMPTPGDGNSIAGGLYKFGKSVSRPFDFWNLIGGHDSRGGYRDALDQMNETGDAADRSQASADEAHAMRQYRRPIEAAGMTAKYGVQNYARRELASMDHWQQAATFGWGERTGLMADDGNRSNAMSLAQQRYASGVGGTSRGQEAEIARLQESRYAGIRAGGDLDGKRIGLDRQSALGRLRDNVAATVSANADLDGSHIEEHQVAIKKQLNDLDKERKEIQMEIAQIAAKSGENEIRTGQQLIQSAQQEIAMRQAAAQSEEERRDSAVQSFGTMDPRQQRHALSLVARMKEATDAEAGGDADKAKSIRDSFRGSEISTLRGLGFRGTDEFSRTMSRERGEAAIAGTDLGKEETRQAEMHKAAADRANELIIKPEVSGAIKIEVESKNFIEKVVSRAVEAFNIWKADALTAIEKMVDSKIKAGKEEFRASREAGKPSKGT